MPSRWMNTLPKIIGCYAVFLALMFFLFSRDDDGTPWWLYAWFTLCSIAGVIYAWVRLERSKEERPLVPE